MDFVSIFKIEMDLLFSEISWTNHFMYMYVLNVPTTGTQVSVIFFPDSVLVKKTYD